MEYKKFKSVLEAHVALEEMPEFGTVYREALDIGIDWGEAEVKAFQAQHKFIMCENCGKQATRGFRINHFNGSDYYEYDVCDEHFPREQQDQMVAVWQISNKPMPEWTRGTYCGKLPGDIKMDGSELAIALETEIDNAAKEVWDDARMSKSTEAVDNA